jgi:hypothetical protein
MGIVLLLGGGPKEAAHALRIELICASAQGPFGRSRLGGALGRQVAKEDDGAQQLIRTLLWPKAILFDEVPRFSMWASGSCWHGTATLP